MAVGHPRQPGHAVYMFHPSATIEDRAETEAFFKTVFGMESVYQREIMTDTRLSYNEDYPTDYSIYTWIGDVWLDTVQPNLHGIHGRDRANPTMRRLVEIGWFVDDVQSALDACERNGVAVWNHLGQPVLAADASKVASAASPDIALFWMDPKHTGLSLELCYMSPEFSAKFGEVCFPPQVNDWAPVKPIGPNPLGIEFCAWHSVATENVARALCWSVDVLGGRVIGETIDVTLHTLNTYVWVGQAMMEFNVPGMAASLVRERLQSKTTSMFNRLSDDVYWSIAFKVNSLEQAAEHLEGVDQPFERLDDHRLLIPPEEGLGVAWCLTDQLAPGDPRG